MTDSIPRSVTLGDCRFTTEDRSTPVWADHVFHLKTKGRDFEQWMLHVSDPHLDSPECDEQFLFHILDEAKDYGAAVTITGDIFDLMQLPGDRRGSLRGLKKRFAEKEALINEAIRYACEKLEPYAKNIILLSEGNHETAVIRHHGMSIIDYVVLHLRRKGSICQKGAYRGWACMKFYRSTKETPNGTVSILYDHDHGGGGKNKGSNKFTDIAAEYHNADVVLTGHTHDAALIPMVKWEYDPVNGPKRREVHYLRCGTSKKGDQKRGYGVEKFYGEKPMKAFWGRYFFDRDKIGKQYMDTYNPHLNADAGLREIEPLGVY